MLLGCEYCWGLAEMFYAACAIVPMAAGWLAHKYNQFRRKRHACQHETP